MADQYDSAEAARWRMVEQQLKARDIVDERVLDAMGRVPRHLFVEPALEYYAYEDRPLSIGAGQTISQPYIVALMIQLLRVQPWHRVLEVGTGSGYQAAILAELAAEVYTVEIIPSLAEEACTRLAALGYGNVHAQQGDGYEGWPEVAPFDGIVVAAGAPQIPLPLIEQLREGGRMAIPVGIARGTQDLILGEKRGGKFLVRSIAPVVFVPLTGKGGAQDW
ncbi:protein-L-isoaspartate(D-aspartate) O-methyltransferase [Candidatus Methylomirabilis sp.]|uniref:protein-L-isoaspartate(D-aspartate) O-methyltransferase n=1 Tax=Candidatus Methylomirabilis sp. TaxID=2032687 RepID=UPI002A61654A|nr:protein-L-isoaspartate(D-aspartate) O-methyltransferase [Candidatus Methylomirabilis sp.]